MKNLLILAAFVATPAMAGEVLDEEVPPKLNGSLSRGMLCETEEQVHAYLTAGEHEDAPTVDGCTMLRITSSLGQPIRIMAIFEPQHWYRVGNSEALVAIIALPPSPSHPEGIRGYGWIAYRPSPVERTKFDI